MNEDCETNIAAPRNAEAPEVHQEQKLYRRQSREGRDHSCEPYGKQAGSILKVNSGACRGGQDTCPETKCPQQVRGRPPTSKTRRTKEKGQKYEKEETLLDQIYRQQQQQNVLIEKLLATKSKPLHKTRCKQLSATSVVVPGTLKRRSASSHSEGATYPQHRPNYTSPERFAGPHRRARSDLKSPNSSPHRTKPPQQNVKGNKLCGQGKTCEDNKLRSVSASPVSVDEQCTSNGIAEVDSFEATNTFDNRLEGNDERENIQMKKLTEYVVLHKKKKNSQTAFLSKDKSELNPKSEPILQQVKNSTQIQSQNLQQRSLISEHCRNAHFGLFGKYNDLQNQLGSNHNIINPPYEKHTPFYCTIPSENDSCKIMSDGMPFGPNVIPQITDPLPLNSAAESDAVSKCVPVQSKFQTEEANSEFRTELGQSQPKGLPEICPSHLKSELPNDISLCEFKAGFPTQCNFQPKSLTTCKSVAQINQIPLQRQHSMVCAPRPSSSPPRIVFSDPSVCSEGNISLSQFFPQPSNQFCHEKCSLTLDDVSPSSNHETQATADIKPRELGLSSEQPDAGSQYQSGLVTCAKYNLHQNQTDEDNSTRVALFCPLISKQNLQPNLLNQSSPENGKTSSFSVNTACTLGVDEPALDGNTLSNYVLQSIPPNPKVDNSPLSTATKTRRTAVKKGKQNDKPKNSWTWVENKCQTLKRKHVSAKVSKVKKKENQTIQSEENYPKKRKVSSAPATTQSKLSPKKKQAKKLPLNSTQILAHQSPKTSRCRSKTRQAAALLEDLVQKKIKGKRKTPGKITINIHPKGVSPQASLTDQSQSHESDLDSRRPKYRQLSAPLPAHTLASPPDNPVNRIREPVEINFKKTFVRNDSPGVYGGAISKQISSQYICREDCVHQDMAVDVNESPLFRPAGTPQQSSPSSESWIKRRQSGSNKSASSSADVVENYLARLPPGSPQRAQQSVTTKDLKGLLNKDSLSGRSAGSHLGGRRRSARRRRSRSMSSQKRGVTAGSQWVPTLETSLLHIAFMVMFTVGLMFVSTLFFQHSYQE